jgi:hypothetical protein
VYLGETDTSEVQFGGTGSSVNIDFEGNALNRVISNLIFDTTSARRIATADAAADQSAAQLAVFAGDGGAFGSTAPGNGGDMVVGAGNGGAYPAGTGGDGGNVLLGAGAGGTGTTAGTGGDVLLVPGSGTTFGSVILGNTSEVEAYLLFKTTGASSPSQSAGPGFKYDDTNGYMQVYNPTTSLWERIATGSGGTVPNGTTYQHLEWNGAWTTVSDITLPNDAARTISVAAQTTIAGTSLTLQAGSTSSGDNGGDLYLDAGDGTVGGGEDGNIVLGGTNGTELWIGNTNALQVHLMKNAATRFYADGGATMVMNDNSDHFIYIETNTSEAGRNLTVSAGATSAVAAVNGGDLVLNGGDSASGTDGQVIIGNTGTSRIEFGGTESSEYQFQANTDNRLISGGDGNTIVMDGDTSHWILVDTPSSANNGEALRIGAGTANGAANNGGDLYLEAGEGGTSGIDGTVHLAATYGYDIHAGAPIQQYLGSSTTYVHHVAIYLGSTTAANTWTEVYQSGSRQFEMENNQVVVADIIVSARVNLVVAAFKYKAVITRDNGVATVVIENTIKETLFNNIGADTDFRVTADTTNGTFKVEVKSHIATQTNWTVGVRATSTVGIVV